MVFKLDNDKNKGFDKNFPDDIKVPLKFDITMLDMFIGFAYKKSNQITRKSLNNMKKLFDVLDERIYLGNDAMITRITFIKKTLHARLNMKMENENVLLNYCRSDVENNYIEEIINNLEEYKRLNFEEVSFINKAIQDRLQYYHILKYKDELYSTIEKLDSGQYSSFQDINTELLNVCKNVVNDSRKAKNITDNNTFSLSAGTFEESVTDIVNKLSDPAKILKSGMQGLNKLLAPGYMSKRLYLYTGLPGGFKSGILLKTCVDIKKYNKGIPTKEGKRPVVLMLTLENTVEESIERLFNMTVDTKDIREFTPAEVIDKLRNEGAMTLSDNDDIDIIIKYFPNKSIDTSDIYTIIEEIEDDGNQVIALVLDYIKRIRPTLYGRDEKEELKNVTNELHDLAIALDICVVTAHQLNRAGAATIDSAMTSNKEDLARFIGRSNVGSALLNSAI